LRATAHARFLQAPCAAQFRLARFPAFRPEKSRTARFLSLAEIAQFTELRQFRLASPYGTTQKVHGSPHSSTSFARHAHSISSSSVRSVIPTRYWATPSALPPFPEQPFYFRLRILDGPRAAEEFLQLPGRQIINHNTILQ
jgi:hypothetical protein